MAHSLSSKKRVRQSAKRKARNRWRKDQIKTEVKAFTAAVTTGKVDAAKEALNKVVAVMDRVATKNTIHRKTASRKRSRMTKRLNKLAAGSK